MFYGSGSGSGDPQMFDKNNMHQHSDKDHPDYHKMYHHHDKHKSGGHHDHHDKPQHHPGDFYSDYYDDYFEYFAELYTFDTYIPESANTIHVTIVDNDEGNNHYI